MTATLPRVFVAMRNRNQTGNVGWLKNVEILGDEWVGRSIQLLCWPARSPHIMAFKRGLLGNIYFYTFFLLSRWQNAAVL
jgi:hypothetical protein